MEAVPYGLVKKRVWILSTCFSLVPALKVPPSHVPLDSRQFGTTLDSNFSMESPVIVYSAIE
ncbi:hypothetical protein CBL_21517 [Carabus blaptoides fortunei]